MQLPKLSSLALLPALAGCATVGMMRSLPPDDGQLAHYAASSDTLAAIAETAIQQQGLAVAEVTRPDTLIVVVIGEKPRGLFGDGEYVRLRIARDTGALTAVRVVTKPGDLLTLWPRERAPRLFQAMDTQLGAQAIGPWPGMRVRAAPRGGAPIIGDVVRVTTDTIVLQSHAGVAPQPLAVGDLGTLAVSRGSYGHALGGQLIGFVVGGLVGALLASSTQDSGDSFAGVGVLLGITIGGSAGTLVGGAVGSGTRTEVWSEIPLEPRP